jgi:phosphoribosylformylglycinamidine cyclo-ligase
MGVGMVALVAPGSVDDALRILDEDGVEAWVCGDVVTADSGDTPAADSVLLEGTYA